MKRENQGGSVSSRRGAWFAGLSLLAWACAQGANSDPGPVKSQGGAPSSGGSAGSTSAGGSGATSSGGSGASTTFGGTNGAGGSTTGGTAGSAGTTGDGGDAGDVGSGGAPESGGSAGNGGAAAGSGNGGAGNGGNGGTNEPSFGGAGNLEDCDAGSAVKVLGEGQTFTGPADSCIGLSVSYAMTKLFLQALPATTSAYPIPFDYASCIGTGSGEFSAVYTNTHLYGTSMTETIPKPDCVIYLKFNGESGETISVIHYG
jgi:hypothetical protein